nr:hypothetical protein [Agrobacterium vitis]
MRKKALPPHHPEFLLREPQTVSLRSPAAVGRTPGCNLSSKRNAISVLQIDDPAVDRGRIHIQFFSGSPEKPSAGNGIQQDSGREYELHLAAHRFIFSNGKAGKLCLSFDFSSRTFKPIL